MKIRIKIKLIIYSFVGFSLLPLILILNNSSTPQGQAVNVSEQEYNSTYLFELARRAIKTYLETGQVITLNDPPAQLKKLSGAFVSMKEDGILRGSIGYMQPVFPLHEAIIRSAISAAVNDKRFIPLKLSELNNVRLEINILSPLTLYDGDREDLPTFVRVGEHGLYVKNGGVSGVLLPSVPVDYVWNSKTFLERTCNKAGFELDCWQKPEYEVYYFTTTMFREPEGEKEYDEVFGPSDTNMDVVNGNLKNFLQQYLDEVNKTVKGVRALIAPHAGYYFSASTAAHSYKNYEPNTTVVVIGPSHFTRFPGVSVLHAKEYESSLGRMEIDKNVVEELDKLSFVRDYEAAFVKEHSIELQINWLNLVGAKKIVPIIVGSLNLDQIQEFVNSLVENNADLVVSVDFSHYHNQTVAEELDGKCLESIVRLDEQQLIRDYVSGECEVDSLESLIVLILYSKKLGLKPTALHYETSANYSGDYDNVVGYHSVVFAK